MFIAIEGTRMKRTFLAVGVLAVTSWASGCASETSTASAKQPKASAEACDCCAPDANADAKATTGTTSRPTAAHDGQVAAAAAGTPTPAADKPAAEGAAPVTGAPKPDAPKPADAKPKADAPAADADKKWTVLFDGKSLDGWKTTQYGGADD